MDSLRDNFHHNNLPETITSAPKNLDRTTENSAWKPTTICQRPSRKDSKNVTHMISGQNSSGTTLRKPLPSQDPDRIVGVASSTLNIRWKVTTFEMRVFTGYDSGGPRNSSQKMSVLFASRIGSCVLVTWSCYASQGRLTWVTGSRHPCHACWDRQSSSLWRPSPQALTISGGAMFIDVCALLTIKKTLCQNSVWWGGTDKSFGS